MDKKLTLAMVLSLLILFAWSSVVSKLYPVQNKDVIENNQLAPVAEQKPMKLTASVSEVKPPSALSAQSFENFSLDFDVKRAAIYSATFLKQQNYVFSLGAGLSMDQEGLSFQMERVSDKELVFVQKDENKEIVKRFIFSNNNYNIELELITKNKSKVELRQESPFLVGLLDFQGKPADAGFKNVVVSTSEKLFNANGRKDQAFDEVKFVAIRDRYFCLIADPDASNYRAVISKISPTQSKVELVCKDWAIPPGSVDVKKFRIYLGPQDLKLIGKGSLEWQGIINFGTFDFIAQILMQMLNWIFQVTHNWGVTIIIFSVLIYLILFPLSLQQLKSMKEMQKLQPKIEELKKQCKDNPQKLNKATMELYKEHKVNPLGGCLPLLLQIPVFFALYQVMMRSVALKGAQFLWIKDLSEPDRLFVFAGNSTGLAMMIKEINILPILMAIGMFVQQKTSAAKMPTTSEAAQQQKLMLVIFPIMFGVIFYRMPSGLVLYWFINSTLTLVNQIRINRAQ